MFTMVIRAIGTLGPFFAAEVPVYHHDHRRTQVQVSQRRSGIYS